MALRHVSSKEAGNSASEKSKGIAMPKGPLKPIFSIKVLMLVTSRPGLKRSSLQALARRENFPNATSSAVTASTMAFRRKAYPSASGTTKCCSRQVASTENWYVDQGSSFGPVASSPCRAVCGLFARGEGAAETFSDRRDERRRTQRAADQLG